VLPVPDQATARLMRAFHRGVADGLDAAAALADATSGCRPGGAADHLAAAAFICLGSDPTPRAPRGGVTTPAPPGGRPGHRDLAPS